MIENISGCWGSEIKPLSAPFIKKTLNEVFFNVCKLDKNPHKAKPCQWVRMLRRYLVSETNLGTTDAECEFVA